MRKLNYLLIFLFMMSVTLQAQSKGQEKQLKKVVSTFVKKVKQIDDRIKKEQALNKFITKINERFEKMDVASLTSSEQQLLKITFTNINNGFASVKGQSHQDLNAYADYVESEFNQALSPFLIGFLGALAIYGIIYLFIIL